MAVRARGSTGCTTCSSALPVVRLESDRSRVVELSGRVRGGGTWEEMLPRCRTDACDSPPTVSKTPPKARLSYRDLRAAIPLAAYATFRR